ncbi:MAG: hypothetical protein IKO25_10800 [Clostridia bacterium]|nr:hypothetical protein [Clostridia bacterium]
MKGVMMMEQSLKKLFDYQKFEGNSALQSVIDSVHSRYSVRELDLDELEYVNAAGISNMYLLKKEQESKEDGNR